MEQIMKRRDRICPLLLNDTYVKQRLQARSGKECRLWRWPCSLGCRELQANCQSNVTRKLQARTPERSRQFLPAHIQFVSGS